MVGLAACAADEPWVVLEIGPDRAEGAVVPVGSGHIGDARVGGASAVIAVRHPHLRAERALARAAVGWWLGLWAGLAGGRTVPSAVASRPAAYVVQAETPAAPASARMHSRRIMCSALLASGRLQPATSRLSTRGLASGPRER